MTNKDYDRITFDKTICDPDDVYGTNGPMRRLYDLETLIETGKLIFVKDNEIKKLQEEVAELGQQLQFARLENLALKNKLRGYENESKTR